ncbi:hypothetical protein BDF22DRAFT_438201 [Syncephalis plumigaleata]|nr:hypothetical protein BDF22DRAFT_438201 [Syncephalis plumigaleata]
MYYLPICHLLLYLSIWLACQPYPTDASLSIIDDKGNNNTYITEDYFLLSQPHYRYEGYLMYWTFSNSSTAPNCTVNTVNKSSRYIQETVAIASNYTNLAIIMNDKDFTNAGCTTKEQAKTAVEDLMSQLEQAEFPPVQLLIISSFAMYVQWEFDYLTYQPDVLFKELATWPRIKFTYTISDDNQLVNNMLYYKHAEHPYVLDSDPGSTNKVYMSTGFLACKWIYFIVLLGMLSYSVVRALVLVRLRKLKLNLLLVAFIITIVYCICKSYTSK